MRPQWFNSDKIPFGSNVGWRYSVVSTDASKEVLGLLQISGSWLYHRSQVRGGRKSLRQTTGLWLIHTVSKSIPTLLPTWNIPGEILQNSYWFQLPLFIFSAKKSPGLCKFTNTLLPVTICLWISNTSHWAKTEYWMCKCCWHTYPIPLLCLYYIFKVCVNAVCSLVKNATFLLLYQTGGMVNWNDNDFDCSTSCLIKCCIRVIFLFN